MSMLSFRPLYSMLYVAQKKHKASLKKHKIWDAYTMGYPQLKST